MGSWNETCAVTNLPIIYPEEVVMLLLKDDETAKALAEPSQLRLRLLRKIELHFGTYNDYGWIRELERDERDSLFVKRRVWDEVVKKDLDDDFVDLVLNKSLEYDLREEMVFWNLEKRAMAGSNKPIDEASKPKITQEIKDMAKVIAAVQRVRQDFTTGLRHKGAGHYDMGQYRFIEKLRRLERVEIEKQDTIEQAE